MKYITRLFKPMCRYCQDGRLHFHDKYADKNIITNVYNCDRCGSRCYRDEFVTSGRYSWR